MATNFSFSTIASIKTGDTQGISMVGSNGKASMFTADGEATIDGVVVNVADIAGPATLKLTPGAIAITDIDLNNVNATDYKVNLDLSGITNASTVVINSGDTSVVLSTTSDKVDTLVFDGNDGNNLITSFEAQDKISFGREVALDELKITGNNEEVSVYFGDSVSNTMVQLASMDTASSAIETGTATLNIGEKKIAAALLGGKHLVAADDTTYFYGFGKRSTAHNNDTSIDAAGTAAIDLTNDSRYMNIDAVKVTDKQKKAIEITANTDKKGTVTTWIDGSTAAAAQTININGSDKVSLGNSAKYADTVKISAGNNSISYFNTGLETNDDTLVLSSVSALSDVTYDSTKAVLTAGKVNTSLDLANVADAEIMKIQLNGSDYKVAANFNNGDDIITTEIDTATNGSEGKQKVMFATEGKAGDAAKSRIKLKSTVKDASFAYTNDKANADLYYTGAGVASIDGQTANGNMYIGDVAAVSTGTGTNIVWSYSQDKAEIQGNNNGTDMIVLSGNFSKDTSVENFDAATDAIWAFTTVDASDTSKYGNVKSLKDFADNFKIAAANGASVAIATGKVDDTDYYTTIVGAKANEAFTVIVGDGSNKYKVATANDGINFATDINYYVGAGEALVSVVASKDAVIAAGNKLDVVLGTETVTDESTVIYADYVDTFDASAADSATITLTGSAKVKNELIGGANGTNNLYGGGSSDDVLTGNASSTDTFKFGIFEGNDVINGGLDAKDTINLYNLTEADIANVTITINGDAAVLNTTNGTLTMIFNLDTVAVDTVSKLTFTDIEGAKYSYNAETGKLVKA